MGERSEISYSRYGDHYIRTVTTHRYEEMEEVTETYNEEVDIISIDGIPYLVNHNRLSLLERLNTPAPKAELEYVSVYNYYIPVNFIDEEVMSRVEELVKEVEELDKWIGYINGYDVYLTKLGRLAKKVTNETKEYESQYDQWHVTEETYYVLEDGTSLTKEIVDYRKYRCRKRAFQTEEGEWVPHEECESMVKEVVEAHDYGEIPVYKSDFYINYQKQKDSLMRTMKDLLQQMVRNKVRIDVQKNGERVKIKVDGDEGEFMYNWISRENYYRGKYGPLAMLFT
jgi:chromosome condensin MukBEF ATPase and DNA-binding subunit MukB